MCWGQIPKEQLNLMPWPKEISTQQGKFNIDKDFSINLNAPDSERLTIATTKFLRSPVTTIIMWLIIPKKTL